MKLGGICRLFRFDKMFLPKFLQIYSSSTFPETGEIPEKQTVGLARKRTGRSNKTFEPFRRHTRM